MTEGSHSMIALAGHLLATSLDQRGARERRVIERAVRRQARRDFEINLKAEPEILALHAKLDQLPEARGLADAPRASTDGETAGRD